MTWISQCTVVGIKFTSENWSNCESIHCTMYIYHSTFIVTFNLPTQENLQHLPIYVCLEFKFLDTQTYPVLRHVRFNRLPIPVGREWSLFFRTSRWTRLDKLVSDSETKISSLDVGKKCTKTSKHKTLKLLTK